MILPPPPSAALKNLRRIFMLRTAVIAFVAGLTLALRQFGLPLPLAPIAAAIGAMALLNLWTWWRLRHAANASTAELGAQLLADLAALTLLFYFTGGYSNPLVWMYLLPIAVAAAALPAYLAWLVALLAIGAYSALVFFHVPLSHLHLHYRPGIGLDTHLAGMWLGFVVSSALLAGAIARIGQNLRESDRRIADAREKLLESERMLALGAMAAATAHELGTPLATMAVLAGEMRREHAGHTQLTQDLALLQQQIARCKEILSSLAASAGEVRGEGAQSVALDHVLHEAVQRCRDSHPALVLDCELAGPTPAPHIAADRTLGQALLNLLDNAADASPQRIEVRGEWDAALLRLSIRDFGGGLAPDIAARAGTPFFTTKTADGMGLGLYLARLILGRFGGTATLAGHPGGGTLAEVRLPLAGLTVERPHG